MVDDSTARLQGAHSGPVLLVVDAVTTSAGLELLHTECFGPAGLVIAYSSAAELFAVLAQLDGCLVATVHGSEDRALSEPLIRRLSALAGRVLWTSWPTRLARLNPPTANGIRRRVSRGWIPAPSVLDRAGW